MRIPLRRLKQIKTFGNSMLPVLLDGDVIFPQKVRFEKIKLNDIVTVRKRNLFFTHRVIYRTTKYLITKGDNNKSSDGKIYLKSIVGVVNKVKRNGQIWNINNLYLIQSSLYFREITKVKKAIEKQNIEYVILKGLPLHLYYEGEIPRKIYADCDILIEKGKAGQVRRVMHQMGYKEVDTSFSEFQKGLKTQDTEITFYKLLNGIPVYFDIHVEVGFMMVQIGKLDALYSQKLLDELTKKFMDEVRNVNVGGKNINILSAENLFIYLILHLYHHNFTGPHRYDLIVSILKKEKLHWSKISSTLNQFKLNNYIYLGILLLQKYYRIKFPNNFISQIRPISQIRLLKKIADRINIFDEKTRFSNGIDKFRLLFELSPRRLARYFVFFNPQVIYFVILTLNIKLRYFFNQHFGR